MKKVNNKIIVVGGDGFCGWPTSLRLSSEGYNVVLVDNLVRRKIDKELKTRSLTPIKSINTRINTWNKISKNKIRFINIDVAMQFTKFYNLVKKFKPSTIIHFGEQRSAPYSMKSFNHSTYTMNNNLNGTLNILNSIVKSKIDIHLVHLGTTGYYGYSSSGMNIPEGYLEIKNINNKKMSIMYPPDPGSIYHMTKCQDSILFLFYNKNYKIKITDLHQGIVWGTQTKLTNLHPNLVNRFDYDGDFGTVLNRFIMQSQINHPLTIYGTGNQTRAFVHIENTTDCICLAVKEKPKNHNRVRIFNQTTQTMEVIKLAKTISKLTKSKIRYYKNPRNEKSSNTLKFENEGLIKLGLKPIKLNKKNISLIIKEAEIHKDRAIINRIITSATWNSNLKIDKIGSNNPIND